MPRCRQIVLSASRRTDIPAFYMDAFMDRIRNGRFEIVNPYNGGVKTVSATPDTVHTIVFWSKNFDPFLSGGFGERLVELGYRLYFSFTINSPEPLLEPNVPPLSDRLEQLETLCKRFDARCVDWRFDPICFYRTADGAERNNLAGFSTIARAAGRFGIRRCITSFLDLYRKVEKRAQQRGGVRFVDPSLAAKVEIVQNLDARLKPHGIDLFLCCEKEVLAALPEKTGVRQSACVPNHRFQEWFGGDISVKRDRGQRVSAGCGCRESVDIGSYALHPCLHSCLFCYANPAPTDP